MRRNRQCWRSSTASYWLAALSAGLGTDYWRIDTGAHAFVGGLTYRPVGGARSWVHYVHVASLDDAVADVERLGAVVLRPRTAVKHGLVRGAR